MSINYAMLFGTETIRRITEETEVKLAKMNLWKNDKEWTGALMQKLAREDYPAFDFDQVAYSVKKMAKPIMIELMNEYTLFLQSLPHVKDSFEYAALFQQKDVLKQLLVRYEGDVRFTEWVTVFHLMLQVLEGELTYDEIIVEARNISVSVKEPVLKLRLKLLAANAHCQLGQFNETFLLLEDVIQEIYELDTGYMKSALASRVFLLVGNCFLYGKGDVESAEINYIAVTATNATPEAAKVAANHGLTLIMMCKNDRQQFAYYSDEMNRKAKETGQSVYCEYLEREYYPFARNIFGETFDIEGVVPEEQAHQYIVRGEKEKALRVIEELEAVGKGGPILTWYKGKATGKRQFLWSALEQLQKEGRYAFLKSLIQKELEHLNTNLGRDV